MARITEKIRVIMHHCTPTSPFYVRWRNSLGGVDHFLFDTRQDWSISTAVSGAYSPFSNDLSTARASVRFLQSEAREQVLCYVEQIDLQTVQGLKKMTFSQRVEWLMDPDLGKWVEIRPVAGSYAIRRTDRGLYDFTVQFNLQPINIPTN